MGRLSVLIYAACVAFVAGDQLQFPIDDTNELTFDWYGDVTAEKVNIANADRNPNPSTHLAEDTKLYRELNGTYKLGATTFQTEYPDSIAWTKTAGFVDTVFYGYQQHHNVIIRPDDVWTAIMIQFSLYVNGNAEALRHSFVNFEGKQDLVVKFRTRINQVDVREFISKINVLIGENIDPAIKDWLLPNFTTTTENDRLTAGVAVMATLQEYFDYELWGIICGIPKATILGTVGDWEEIRDRLERLKDFELDGKTAMKQWSSMLRRILDEFVRVKKTGEPNSAFWKQAIRVDYRLIDLVCAKINETTLNGWITTFSAFNLAGKWRGQDPIDPAHDSNWPWLKMRTDKITPGTVHVPIKIKDEYAEESKREYTGAIITGHMGYSVKRDEKTIQPLSGWYMMVTNDPPQYMTNNKNNNLNNNFNNNRRRERN